MNPRTVGVEEELLLLDSGTGEPRAVAGGVLRADQEATAEPAGNLAPELQQQQIETETTPCADLAELEGQLIGWRRRVDALAQQRGARVAALATSPLPVMPTTTLKSRYQTMIEHFGLTTLEQLTCGCHIHVAVESAEEGVAVLDRIRPWLPVVLALSANSPYWQGRDSGYASFRSQAWARFPSAGPTELFGSARGYELRMQALVDSETVLDRQMVYFDARLSERFPTVEIRVADVCLDVRDAVLVAALARALVETAVTGWRAGQPAAEWPIELLRLSTWRAGRSGLGGNLLDPVTARPRPAAGVVADLVGHVRDALTETDDLRRVTAAVDRLLVVGTGAVRQRRWYADHRRLAAVALNATEATVAIADEAG